MGESIWDLEEFTPYQAAFEARRQRLQLLEGYYKGTMYKPGGLTGVWPLNSYVSQAQKEVKVLFHPLAAAVHTDVALVPGGWELDEDSAALQETVNRVLKVSRWRLLQDAFVHWGAAMGQTTLKIVDIPQEKRAVLYPLRPDMVLPIGGSVYEPALTMAIVVYTEMRNGKQVEVAEVIEPDRVRTFVGGEPMGIGGREAVFSSELGFVPIVDVPFVFTGATLGECTYEAALNPMNEANSAATDLREQIKRHVEPQWAAMIEDPANNANDLEKSGDNVWWFPTGSSIEALVANLDIEGVLNFIKEIKTDVKEQLPEMLIWKLVGLNRIAVPAVEVQLLPLTMKVQRARRSVDEGLARALRMVGRATAVHGGDGAVAALDVPELMFEEQRPVIFMDALSSLELEGGRLALDSARFQNEQERMLLGDGV